MSIRINKVLGYGLTDVKTDSGVITDERFNLDSAYFDDEDDEKYETEDYLEELSVEKYLAFLQQKIDRENKHFSMDYVMLKNALRNKETFTIRNSFIHDIEGGDENVFCIVPVNLQNKWVRVDDALDYYEYMSHSDRNTQPNVTLLEGVSGIYPYQGSVDKRTGRVLPLQQVQDWSNYKSKNDVSDLLEFFSKELGFSSVEEAEENIIMQPSPDVVDLLEFSQLLSDSKHVYDFKPMLYTYWS